jgi:formiminotetrahydrofolate cyclodeaminase
VISLEARNKHLTEALAATAQTPPKSTQQEDKAMATMDAKVEKINARVSDVISRFETYIHEKATNT